MQSLRYVDFNGAYMKYHPAAPLPTVYANYQRYAGEFQVVSAGPDKKINTTDPNLQPAPLFWVISAYDATNGTVSAGDIIRTQKNPEGYIY